MKHFATISEFHDFAQLHKPQHPLLSVVDVGTVPHREMKEPVSMVLDFYAISLKRMQNVHVEYGQHSFDFNEGVLSFMAPKQVFTLTVADQTKAIEKSGNAVLYRVRTGIAWRDLPERFGSWNTVARRFQRWAQAGAWQGIFQAVQEPDYDWVLVDSTTVKAHKAAADQKKRASRRSFKP